MNNVLGFPYIFRGALDVRARRVNMEMKIACANALAQLAREDVPDEVAAAYALTLASQGNVTTLSMKAFTVEQMGAIVAKMP